MCWVAVVCFTFTILLCTITTIRRLFLLHVMVTVSRTDEKYVHFFNYIAYYMNSNIYYNRINLQYLTVKIILIKEFLILDGKNSK